MFTNTAAGKEDYLRKFIRKDFLDSIMNLFNETLTKLKTIDEYVFSGLAKLINDVQNFKNSLLKFILDSLIQLKVLKDNFEKPRYQQASAREKLDFIKERLEKIKSETLSQYIEACQKLIQTTLDLHKEYGSGFFKLKCTFLNIFGFTTIGAVVGLSIGLFLPVLGISMGVGAAVGVLGGLAYVIYQFTVNWKQQMKKIEIVCENLLQINNELQTAKEQLCKSYTKLGESKVELGHQQLGKSFQELPDLEQYVVATHQEFINLQQVLMNWKVTRAV